MVLLGLLWFHPDTTVCERKRSGLPRLEFADGRNMLAEWRWSHLLSAGWVIQSTNQIAIYFDSWSRSDTMAMGMIKNAVTRGPLNVKNYSPIWMLHGIYRCWLRHDVKAIPLIYQGMRQKGEKRLKNVPVSCNSVMVIVVASKEIPAIIDFTSVVTFLQRKDLMGPKVSNGM